MPFTCTLKPITSIMNFENGSPWEKTSLYTITWNSCFVYRCYRHYEKFSSIRISMLPFLEVVKIGVRMLLMFLQVLTIITISKAYAGA